MQYYKNVCGNNEFVWLSIEPGDNKKILRWAKQMGCVWFDGTEINPEEEVNSCYFSMSNDGKFDVLPASMWFSDDPNLKKVLRCRCKFTY